MEEKGLNWRVYYNRSNDFPYVWSVDRGAGTEEINVKTIRLHMAIAHTCYDPNGDNKETPRGWFAVTGHCTFRDGEAHFYP